MVVRWMLKSDIETVSEIRDECSLNHRDFMKVLSSPSCILKVAELDGNVAGFVNYKNGRKKIKILEFATTSRLRRKGVACKLIKSIVAKASESSKKIEVAIPERNLEAQMLLKKCGFKASKIVRSSAGDFYTFKMEATKCQKECS